MHTCATIAAEHTMAGSTTRCTIYAAGAQMTATGERARAAFRGSRSRVRARSLTRVSSRSTLVLPPPHPSTLPACIVSHVATRVVGDRMHVFVVSGVCLRGTAGCRRRSAAGYNSIIYIYCDEHIEIVIRTRYAGPVSAVACMGHGHGTELSRLGKCVQTQERSEASLWSEAAGV